MRQKGGENSSLDSQKEEDLYQEDESTLQLFSYDLVERKEEEVDEIYIDEYYDPDEKNQSNKEAKNKKTEDTNDVSRIYELLDYFRTKNPSQFNINFSVPFGTDVEFEFDNDEEFLKNQYFTF